MNSPCRVTRIPPIPLFQRGWGGISPLRKISRAKCTRNKNYKIKRFSPQRAQRKRRENQNIKILTSSVLSVSSVVQNFSVWGDWEIRLIVPEQVSARQVMFLSDQLQATYTRALRNIRSHGPSSPHSSGCHEYCVVRNRRSGCGIMMVKRPSAVVKPVKPSGEPFGLCG